jgi:phage terminase large subunit GpA-like protein
MKKATAEVFRRIFKTLEPPPIITMSEWADENRVISGGAMPGRWKTDMVPYMREIMNAISDVSVPKVVIMSSAQIAKTHGAVLNTIGYFMHYDPSPILVVQPTLEAAQSFSKEKLAPMLADTPALRGMVDDKRRDSKNQILYKQFPGGSISIVGANSGTGLRSRSIRILLADEVDGYPPTANKEGDPLMLAEKRTTTYWNSKLVYMSTPTNSETSRIAVEYENSSKEVWNVPCPVCGYYQPLEWSGVIFDKANLEEINYVCAKCGVVSGEYEWKELFVKGRFVAEEPEQKVRGFHLSELSKLVGR